MRVAANRLAHVVSCRRDRQKAPKPLRRAVNGLSAGLSRSHLVNSTLRAVSYRPRRALIRSSPISRSRSLRRPGPAGGLRASRARTAKLITTARQTRNYASTARHEPRYRITACPPNEISFSHRGRLLREKAIEPAGRVPITSVNRLRKARDFLQESVVCILITRQTVK